MDLKNMTMDDLKQKLAAVDKKTLIKFGSGFGAAFRICALGTLGRAGPVFFLGLGGSLGRR